MVSAVYDAQGGKKGRLRWFVPIKIYFSPRLNRFNSAGAFVSMVDGYGMSGKLSPEPLIPVVWRGGE